MSHIETRAERLVLTSRKKVYTRRIAPGIRLGYRRTAASGSWSVIVSDGTGSSRMKRFAQADDYEESNHHDILTFSEAWDAALIIARGPPRPNSSTAITVERVVADKAKAFLRDKIEPACCLYRHYDVTGDLLYVGISLGPVQRQRSHMKMAHWRHQIHRILIEPFVSRKDAMNAERIAILVERPRFNIMHNALGTFPVPEKISKSEIREQRVRDRRGGAQAMTPAE